MAVAVLIGVLVILLVSMKAIPGFQSAAKSAFFMISAVALNVLTFVTLAMTRSYKTRGMALSSFVVFVLGSYVTTMAIAAQLTPIPTALALSVAFVTALVHSFIDLDHEKKVPRRPLVVCLVVLMAVLVLNLLIFKSPWDILIGTSIGASLLVLYIGIELGRYIRDGRCEEENNHCCIDGLLNLYVTVTDPGKMLDRICEARSS